MRTIHKLELPNRVTDSILPPVQVVDMREELKNGNRGIFSRVGRITGRDDLARRTSHHLPQPRGTATYIFCRDCGHVLKCPNCETPLTLHLESKEQLALPSLRIHTQKAGQTCPQCNSGQIREYGLGSEKVEADVKSMFPQVRTLALGLGYHPPKGCSRDHPDALRQSPGGCAGWHTNARQGSWTCLWLRWSALCLRMWG
jgi:primosomal protein N' (replication factor Y) (superfamily II helicase)